MISASTGQVHISNFD